MREQTKKFNKLLDEFKALTKELFQGCSFIEVDENDPKQLRYNQLFMWLHPEFRTKEYINPLED